METPDSARLDAISRHAFDAEADCVAALLETAAPFESFAIDIRDEAATLVAKVRKAGPGLSVEAFLQEYGLSTKEGIAVMCLAEALLRIPDAATADALIVATLGGADFAGHLGKSASPFVNASSWGLMLTGKLLDFADGEGDGLWERPARKRGGPAIRRVLTAAMGLIAGQFVLGETIGEAIRNGRKFAKRGYRFSYDMLGEGARTAEQAETYLAAYEAAIDAVGSRSGGGDPMAADSLSIKLTALHPRYEWRQRARVMDEMLPRLKALVVRAKEAGIAVAIDAEEATRLDLELEVFTALWRDPAFAGYDGLGFVLQAYQKRAIHVLDHLAVLARDAGRRMPVRLVKGAYWDSEVKAAQIAGLPDFPVFTRKAHTDLSYLACARKLIDAGEIFYPQFATHNAHTLAAVRRYASGRAEAASYEFQRLHGMGEALYEPVVSEVPCRIYAPVGAHRDLLAYLIRRLLENGASTSFVKLLFDDTAPIGRLLDDPLAASRAEPDGGIGRPDDLYAPSRPNSRGFDFGNREATCGLEEPLTSLGPSSVDADPQRIEAALAKAASAGSEWGKQPVEIRSAVLRRAADLLAERQRDAMRLIVVEGGRTWPDALSEVREAEDFLRYYAAEAEALMQSRLLPGPTGERNLISLHPRGVWAAISPWNFPLSIFVGQIAAALATGNAVIAKPAEQTPRVAAWAVSVLHEAGIPADALAFLPGPGETVGAALVKDSRIDGVVFTGGMAAAKHIQRALAERDGPIVPLIAETGGQNAMVVDSSALPEQACDDILNSAFGSAGQRCSSLRVLFVQNEIADGLIALLAGAMSELVLGDPLDLATDIGPLIDAEAAESIRHHLAWLANVGRRRGTVPLPADLRHDPRFVAPEMWEIPSITLLKREVFGPVLHVVRYASAERDRVLRELRATGYGLTFGLHSRLPSAIEIAGNAPAGNCYVNRGITGAVVGTQPFGGEGLSGTGPKAGGPFYLPRFVTERVVTVNTAAIGGNVELLGG